MFAPVTATNQPGFVAVTGVSLSKLIGIDQSAFVQMPKDIIGYNFMLKWTLL